MQLLFCLITLQNLILTFKKIIKKAETEKDLGNDAYKKKDFETALKHYEKAAELCPTAITYLTNQAGDSFFNNQLCFFYAREYCNIFIILKNSGLF